MPDTGLTITLASGVGRAGAVGRAWAHGCLTQPVGITPAGQRCLTPNAPPPLPQAIDTDWKFLSYFNSEEEAADYVALLIGRELAGRHAWLRSCSTAAAASQQPAEVAADPSPPSSCASCARCSAGVSELFRREVGVGLAIGARRLAAGAVAAGGGAPEGAYDVPRSPACPNPLSRPLPRAPAGYLRLWPGGPDSDPYGATNVLSLFGEVVREWRTNMQVCAGFTARGAPGRWSALACCPASTACPAAVLQDVPRSAALMLSGLVLDTQRNLLGTALLAELCTASSVGARDGLRVPPLPALPGGAPACGRTTRGSTPAASRAPRSRVRRSGHGRELHGWPERDQRDERCLLRRPRAGAPLVWSAHVSVAWGRVLRPGPAAESGGALAASGRWAPPAAAACSQLHPARPGSTHTPADAYPPAATSFASALASAPWTSAWSTACWITSLVAAKLARLTGHRTHSA